MSVLRFLEKYKNDLLRILAALLLCGIAAAFVFAFRGGKLPYSEDGDAFDTIYAIEESI